MFYTLQYELCTMKLFSFRILNLSLLLLPTISFGSPQWTSGTKASSTATVLSPIEKEEIQIPSWLAKEITQETAVFYFSPTCPHCQHALPEIQRIYELGVPVIGITTKNTDDLMTKAFIQAYEVKFPILHDEVGDFSKSMASKYTPSVYLVSPSSTPVENTTESTPTTTALIADMYHPFSRGMGSVLLVRRNPQNPFAYFKGYQGNTVCHQCHTEEAKSWALTHHAQAYATLQEIKKDSEEKCVSCHVVGLGQETGFTLNDHTSSLRNVGCEACHTASGPHDAQYSDPKTACLQCHDKKHSIAFSLEKGLPHIDHFISNTYSEVVYQDKLQQLTSGLVDRPLLAMPKGEYAGSKICSKCHQDVHPNDPHEKAFQSLPKESRKSLECVRCHTTPNKEIPQKLSHYQNTSGVGCESCHGPAKEHVKNPIADNVIHLGDSCPQCVLESLCTSCHNQEWDPSWDLEKRLEVYKLPLPNQE